MIAQSMDCSNQPGRGSEQRQSPNHFAKENETKKQKKIRNKQTNMKNTIEIHKRNKDATVHQPGNSSLQGK